MGVETNTYLTYDSVGQRESLAEVIYQISPEDTVFLSAIGRGSSKAVLEEWQTDVLAAASDSNAQLEGDEPGFDAEVPTVRVGNYHQISRKQVIVSGTHEVVSKAGRKSEMAYKIAQKGAELKLDIEAAALSQNVANPGALGTARTSAGIESWIVTNSNRGAGGVNPQMSGAGGNGYPDTASQDGTLRAFDEDILNLVMASLFTNAGSKDRTLFVGPVQKQLMRTFEGLSNNRWQVGGGAAPITVVGAVEAYVSDFGKLFIVPCRNLRDETALFIDPSMVEISYLRPFFRKDLASVGDNEKAMLIAEWTLKVHNEAALGIAADLDPSP